MQIIGFNFEKIQAERKNNAKGKIEISSNINIKSVTQESLDLVKEKPTLKFSFEFSLNYKPDIASLLFQGFVISIFEKEQAREILKKFKSKKISDEVRIPLFNFILSKCNLRALQFEEELSLPFHIPFPRISHSQQSNNTNYTG